MIPSPRRKTSSNWSAPSPSAATAQPIGVLKMFPTSCPSPPTPPLIANASAISCQQYDLESICFPLAAHSNCNADSDRLLRWGGHSCPPCTDVFIGAYPTVTAHGDQNSEVAEGSADN